MNNELERTWKEAFVAQFEVVSRCLLRGTGIQPETSVRLSGLQSPVLFSKSWYAIMGIQFLSADVILL
jgi:hypothetical protein